MLLPAVICVTPDLSQEKGEGARKSIRSQKKNGMGKKKKEPHTPDNTWEIAERRPANSAEFMAWRMDDH